MSPIALRSVHQHVSVTARKVWRPLPWLLVALLLLVLQIMSGTGPCDL